MNLREKISTHKAEIGLVGLGYAGLPMGIEFALSGLTVHGIDTDKDKVRDLNHGRSHVQDVEDKVLQGVIDSGHFRAHSDYQVVSQLDCILICVPTPLRQTKDPDISYIMDAAQNIRRHLHKNMLIVL